MDSADLVRILSEMPPVRLRLIDLAWKVVGDDGSLDKDKAAFYATEIAAAVKEAEAYSDATRGVIHWLTHYQH